MSAMARAMRPLPSSNGWMVTNHRCARAADRGAHRLPVEHRPLDLAGLDHLLGQALEDRLAAQRKTEPLHAPDQPPLLVAHGRDRLRQNFVVPAEFGPVRQSMDVCWHNLRTSCGEYGRHSPQPQWASPQIMRRIKALFP